jgi:hypothetical protein
VFSFEDVTLGELTKEHRSDFKISESSCRCPGRAMIKNFRSQCNV